MAAFWAWFFKNEKDFCEKLYNAALEANKEEKYKKANGLFSKITRINSSYKDAKYRLGLTYLDLCEYENAVDCFETIIKATPKNFDALFHLAIAFQHLKKYNNAEEAYTKALSENVKSGDCLFGLGFINYCQKKYEQAIEYFEKADETYEDKIKLMFYVNKCNDELATYDQEIQGETIIAQYLRLANEPNLPKEFNIAIAKAYAKTGQIESSMEYCKKALLVNSEDIESYKLLGLLQLVQQDYAGTKSTLSTGLHLQQSNKEMHNLLSYAFCQQVDSCALSQCRAKYHELINKFLKEDKPNNVF